MVFSLYGETKKLECYLSYVTLYASESTVLKISLSVWNGAVTIKYAVVVEIGFHPSWMYL